MSHALFTFMRDSNFSKLQESKLEIKEKRDHHPYIHCTPYTVYVLCYTLIRLKQQQLLFWFSHKTTTFLFFLRFWVIDSKTSCIELGWDTPILAWLTCLITKRMDGNWLLLASLNLPCKDSHSQCQKSGNDRKPFLIL